MKKILFLILCAALGHSQLATDVVIQQRNTAGTFVSRTVTGSLFPRGTLSFDATGVLVGGLPFAGTIPGVVPASLGGTLNFLRADGIWSLPPGGTLAATLTAGNSATGQSIIEMEDIFGVNGGAGTPAKLDFIASGTNGGEARFEGGALGSALGATLRLEGGTATGAGGNLEFYGGISDINEGGKVALSGGSDSGIGGTLYLYGGNGEGFGGDVYFAPGTGEVQDGRVMVQGDFQLVPMADPPSPQNGFVWYNSTSNALKARINGATVALGAAPPVFAGTTPGLVPTSVGGTTNFLRADGSWAQPPSSLDGAGGHASFTFNATTTEPVTGNQVRVNNSNQTLATRLWVSQTSTDGLDVTVGLAKIQAGHQIYFQDRDDASKWVKYSVITDGVDDGAYWDFAVAYHSGPGGVPAATIELQAIAPGAVGVPPGGTTGQALTKTNNTDYAVQWTTIAGGGGDVVGPASATDNAIARYDLTTGKLLQNSTVILADNGVITTPAARVLSATPMAGLAVDVTKGNNTKTITAASTLTLSATPAADTWFGLKLTASGGPWVVTLPAGTWKSAGNNGVTITTITLQPGQVSDMQINYDGAIYWVYGEPITAYDLSASTIELGHATANTLSAAGGILSVEGVPQIGTTAIDTLAELDTLTQLPVEFCVAMSDETTAITTGAAKVTLRAPYAFTLTNVRASVNTVSSSGIPTVDINEGAGAGTSVLSTKLTIDASEFTSTTAAAAHVISDSAIADDAQLTFDIDVAGTGAKGLKVWVYGYR